MADPLKTPEDLLAEIWALTAAGMISSLTEKPTAALLNVALKFLADSGVSLETLRRLKTRNGNPLGDLAGKLPFFGEEAEEPADTSPAPLQSDILDYTDDPIR